MLRTFESRFTWHPSGRLPPKVCDSVLMVLGPAGAARPDPSRARRTDLDRRRRRRTRCRLRRLAAGHRRGGIRRHVVGPGRELQLLLAGQAADHPGLRAGPDESRLRAHRDFRNRVRADGGRRQREHERAPGGQLLRDGGDARVYRIPGGSPRRCGRAAARVQVLPAVRRGHLYARHRLARGTGRFGGSRDRKAVRFLQSTAPAQRDRRGRPRAHPRRGPDGTRRVPAGAGSRETDGSRGGQAALR